MNNIYLVIIFLLVQVSCQNQQTTNKYHENTNFSSQITLENTNSNISNESVNTESQNEDKEYAGVTIDQIFPLIEDHDFRDENFKDKNYSIKADEFSVTFKDFTPKTIQDEEGRTVFSFKTLHKEGYWANLVGNSHLLGKNSKEIYIAVSGTGGVCCTNYWVTDVSNGTPRNIFRSEDFGYFRDAMEILDADGDGIYELVQFDSAFRYFMDDCGSCSPEPRAVFKYDKKSRTYLPAKSIQQDFVKQSFVEMGKHLEETFEKMKIKENFTEEPNFKRDALAYVVDLFYLGDERKAWKTFDKYFSGWVEKEKIRAEIKNRLRQSKFYQALKKS